MKSFVRLAIGLFILCLVVFSFAYFFGPPSVRESFHSKESPVGQLRDNNSLQPEGQPSRQPASQPNENK